MSSILSARNRRTTLRFRRRKSFAGGLAHPLASESLEAPAVEVVADVNVAFTINCERMRHVQRSAENPLPSTPEVTISIKRMLPLAKEVWGPRMCAVFA
jgi:hypothetical protein